MENTTKAPSSSTARIHTALLGPNAVLEESGVIESVNVVGLRVVDAPIDGMHLPTAINLFNAPIHGNISNSTFIGVNIEQHLPEPPSALPEQTMANELDYYITTAFVEQITLKLCEQTKPIKKMAISGITGSGKTVLAKHCYQEHQNEYSIHQILFAETCEQWWQSLTNFAKTLSPGLKESIGILKEEKKQELIVKIIQEALSKKSWRILIDNWDSITGPKWQQIEAILNRGNGLLLITTQHPAPFPEKNRSIDLNRVSNKESDILLYVQESRRLLDKILEPLRGSTSLGTQKEQDDLAKALNYLPLALVQAGCYLLWENISGYQQGKGCTYQEYQQRLDEELNVLYTRHSGVLTEDRDYVPRDEDSSNPEFKCLKIQEAAVSLAIKKTIWLSEEGQCNHPLLSILCFNGFLADESTPQQLLKNYLQKLLGSTLSSEETLEKKFGIVLNAARKYSLMQYETEPSAIDGSYNLHMHRVVKKILRQVYWPRLIENDIRFSEIKSLQLMQDTLVDALYDALEKENFDMIRAYYPHSEKLLSVPRLEETTTLENNEWSFAHHQSDVARAACLLGYHIQSERHFRQILAAVLKKVGEKAHPKVVWAQQNLAVPLKEQGRYKEAEELSRKALRIKVELHGMEIREDIMWTIQNLANNLMELGRYQEAKELYLISLVKTIEYFGNAAQIAGMENNLAIAFEKLGQHVHALKYYFKALMKKKQIYPKLHIQIAETEENLAGTLISLGRYHGAEMFYRSALAKNIKHYGADHIAVSRVQRDLALVLALNEKGSNIEAKNLCEKALEIQNHFYGEQHIEISLTKQNLAIILTKQGRYIDAEGIFNDILPIRIAHYGSDHIAIAITYQHLAENLEGLKEYKKAIGCCERSLKIIEEKYCFAHLFIRKLKEQLNNLVFLLEIPSNYLIN
ncbi:MAG: hypothetical protein CK424_02910 [Legionella sp.]|nr:MAG: hypothetical protein CK424_02910 [Legionella sp.]